LIPTQHYHTLSGKCMRQQIAHKKVCEPFEESFPGLGADPPRPSGEVKFVAEYRSIGGAPSVSPPIRALLLQGVSLVEG
jgi:hypothetical protein